MVAEILTDTTQFMQQDTAWFARQLINTQFVGEFEPATGMKIDVRAAYANSQRQAPGELSFEYARTNVPSDPFERNGRLRRRRHSVR